MITGDKTDMLFACGLTTNIVANKSQGSTRCRTPARSRDRKDTGCDSSWRTAASEQCSLVSSPHEIPDSNRGGRRSAFDELVGI